VLRRHLDAGHLVEIGCEVPALTIKRRIVWPEDGLKARRAAAVAAALVAAAGTGIDGALPR
jgi:LysR family glycine cleavage system transcriptional activator